MVRPGCAAGGSEGFGRAPFQFLANYYRSIFLLAQTIQFVQTSIKIRPF
jgi:hypothetical protein